MMSLSKVNPKLIEQNKQISNLKLSIWKAMGEYEDPLVLLAALTAVQSELISELRKTQNSEGGDD